MPVKHYPDVNPNPDFPRIEEEILAFWAENRTFEASVHQKPADNEFVFYDGPPFANGLPHYGHLLTGYVKDTIARYQTMQGKRVDRRFGWDCHGLPAEMGSEKELGISGRAAITNFGIGKFNEHCRTSVMKYTQEWEHYVTRQARWVDFKNDYKTMDKNFMESVLWAFKRLWDMGYIYEAHRVMPYSWAAETPLSNFETKLDNSYREREDKAIYVTFDLNNVPDFIRNFYANHKLPVNSCKVVAWTTTPWTLPSNLALAVSAQGVPYGTAYKDGVCYITSDRFLPELGKILGINIDEGGWTGDPDDGKPSLAFSGKEILGLSYHPLFPYFASHKHSFKILDGSSFVTDGDGTGIVHMAPGFGEDDQKVCEANGIELVVPVDGQGKYTDAVFDLPDLKLKGLNVIAEINGQTTDEPYKPEQVKKYGLVNLRIINWLKNHGQLIKQEEIKHNYPHCWRTDQPLIYRAMPSWYVEVTKFRDRAVEINQQINWIPDHIRDGQMGHMLATAPDWSISRNRFWGTPIPVWRSDNPKNDQLYVFGSISELEAFFKVKVEDLHRPYIDELIAPDPTDPKYTLTRVADVFDCWFESGSMPFAQVHYPFENKEWFESHFPADFITEYVGQTRGWFNTLIMLSTALFDKPPFLNCICHGVVLDAETGLKYSKRLKNYKDPLEVINQYGADALRWLMIASPVMRGQDLMVDPEGKFIRDVVRLAIKPIWNAYNFFCLYANADGVKAKFASDSTDVMDRYILAKCRQSVETIRTSLDAYDTPSACEAILQFFDVLNNWYIRRSKERFWKEEVDADKQAAYDTLYTVLTTMSRAAASLLPMTMEEIYKGLNLPLPPGEGRGEGLSTHERPKTDFETLDKARSLRKHATDAEQLLWSLLRDRQLNNAKFKRQQPMGQYIADFYCHEAKLIIELDGGQHSTQQDYDEKRTAYFTSQGLKVLRFWNNDVLENTEGVWQTIADYFTQELAAPPSPQPSPEGRGSISVHLAEFPDVGQLPQDVQLMESMEFIQDICNAALAVRNKLNIRVRQPLALLKLTNNPLLLKHMYNGNEDIVRQWNYLLNIVKEEVNVKDVKSGSDKEAVTDYATLKLQVNNPVLGKRLPEKMKQIIPASKKGEWKRLDDGKVEICGEIIIPTEEFNILLEPKPEYKDRAQALSTNDALVILDTHVTPELEAEGYARDVVRLVQQARKDAGLHVSDRITLAIDAPEVLTKAITTHKDYITEQTLAVSLESGKKAADYTAEQKVEDHTVTIGVSKAA